MKSYLILIIALIVNTSMVAQYSYDPISMSKGLHEAVIFTADKVDDRRVEKLWRDFIEEYNGDTDRNRKENEYVTSGASIIEIGGTVPVDLYFRAEEYGDNTRVYVWFMTKGAFLNLSENPALQKSAEQFLDEFRLKVRKWRVSEQIEAEEDQLEDLERDLGKLIRLKERYEDRIEDAKKEIEENKEDIKENIVEQEAMKQNIKEQRAVVEKMKEMLNNLKIDSE